jgi:NitT/TauT family transport system substrate-binding protein
VQSKSNEGEAAAAPQKGEKRMKRRWSFGLAALAIVSAVAVAGCGGSSKKSSAGGGGQTGGSKCSKTDNVTLQLKWVTQAQFAGYYAAADKGFYKDQCLNVSLKVGGPDITPEQVVASGQAEFGIDWLPSLLATRDKGGDLVNIAQVFTRSGMTELTWKDSGITAIKQMAHKKVGVWCCGNQFELYAALTKNGIDPNNKSDVTIVNQPFDMNLFLKRQVQAAAAMTYNELAQVLETQNPKTKALYTPADLNVLKLQDQGTGMLEDGVFSTSKWLSSSADQDIAKRFLAASFKGWAYCRDHFQDCVSIVLQHGPTLGKGHQTWQMNEINALIWPAPKGIGVMDAAAYKTTADIALKFKVIAKPASSAAYRTDLAQAADALVSKQGVDTNGNSWQKASIQVTAGGK